MTTRVICNLSQFGLIHFSGEQAQSFLHGQLSCDVNGVTADRSIYGGYCTPKGRMLASFLFWRSTQGFFMQLPASLRKSVQKRIATFILRAKVKAADASDEWGKLGVVGKDASTLIERVLGRVPQAVHDVVHLDDATVIRLPVDRFEIIVPKHRAPGIVEALADSAKVTDASYWDWLDIHAGIPVITSATQEAFVPQMVNLELIGGVSFTKGCYPGQEIVARMHYRGQVKQRMYLAHIATEAIPQPGDRLYSADAGEQPCGMVVIAACAPAGGHDALAVVQTTSFESGQVHWKALDGPVLEFLPLPYRVQA